MALEVWSAALTRVLAEKLQTGDDAAGAAIRRIAAAAAGRRRLPDKTNRAQHEPNFDAFAILILGCRLHRHHIALAVGVVHALVTESDSRDPGIRERLQLFLLLRGVMVGVGPQRQCGPKPLGPVVPPPRSSAPTLRHGHHGQSLVASRVAEPIIKGHEGQRLAHLALQIEAAGKLHGVARP